MSLTVNLILSTQKEIKNLHHISTITELTNLLSLILHTLPTETILKQLLNKCGPLKTNSFTKHPGVHIYNSTKI